MSTRDIVLVRVNSPARLFVPKRESNRLWLLYLPAVYIASLSSSVLICNATTATAIRDLNTKYSDRVFTRCWRPESPIGAGQSSTGLGTIYI